MGLWIFLLILFVIFVVPYGVDAGYIEKTLRLKVKAGPLRITILPKKPKTPKQEEKAKKKKAEKDRKKSEKKAQKESEKKARKEKEKTEGAEKKKKKSSLPPPSEWPALFRMATDALKRVFRSFSLDYLMLHLVVATADPYDTGTRYAYITAALDMLLDEESGLIRLKKQDIAVDMDFTSEEMLTDAEVVISVQLYKLVAAAIVVLVQFLRWRRRYKKTVAAKNSLEAEKSAAVGAAKSESTEKDAA